jgi:hypothetical protein
MTFKLRVTATAPALITAGITVGFVAGMLAYRTAQDMTQLSDLKTASAAQPVGDGSRGPGSASRDPDAFPTDLVRVPQADQLAAALRKLGYDVHFMTDDDLEKGRVTKERYSVIVIGRAVPAKLATTAIRLTHRYLPWVKYVYLQFQYPEMDRHIVLNAHDGWVASLGLKPVSEADFARLSDDKLSLEQLHTMLRKFRN